MTSKTELKEILNIGKTNQWIHYDGLTVYLRVSHYPYKGKLCKRVVHLATMDADEPGKGSLRRFLSVIEELAIESDIPLMMVENVLNERLVGFLEREGWEQHNPPHRDDILFYKELRSLEEEDLLS